MPATNIPLIGDALLVAVTKAMVAFHERYHHRKPVTAKTLLLGGELLVCVHHQCRRRTHRRQAHRDA